MTAIDYAVLAVALFFAGSWTLGVLIRPNLRLKATIVTIVLWWAEIGTAIFSAMDALHLLWLMPASLFGPSMLAAAQLQRSYRVSMPMIFTVSAALVSAALFALS